MTREKRKNRQRIKESIPRFPAQAHLVFLVHFEPNPFFLFHLLHHLVSCFSLIHRPDL